MAFLLQARVRVFWGKINLSAYDGQENFPAGQPVVYDVDVNLAGETQGPTATMKWDPTGPGMALYESFLTNKELMASQIKIDFFYPGGKYISFIFIWTGQSISYGNDMSITIKLQSELAGLINSNQRSVAQADTTGKGLTLLSEYDNAKKLYGLEKYTDIVQFTKKAEEDNKKAKLNTSYAVDSVFGSYISNLAQQNGNMAYANNIGKSNIVIYTPFSWDKEGVVKNGVTDIPAGSSPDPKERYGYLLGPSTIQTITRSVEWKPPQQTNSDNPNTQTRALPPRDELGRFTKKAPAKPQDQTSKTQDPTAAPLGVSGGRSTPGIGNADNPDQVPKQNALNEEKSSSLNLSTYMVPALLGIKPHDILYIPSYKGDYMEDWIVQSVDYNQSDGKVDIGIQASRVYGVGTPMSKKNSDKFLEYAKSINLVGEGASLENWDKYAWVYPLQQGSTPVQNSQAKQTAAAKEAAEVKYYNDRYGEA
jgi:hypothetical protein